MSTYTTDVQVHPSLGHKKHRPSPYLVRWRIAGKDKSKSFKKQKDAASFRATLTTAALSGQKFDRTSGLPVERKSTRLNSSHVAISYAVFCLKKKRNK